MLAGPTRRKAFERGHLFSRHTADGERARTRLFAVDQHGTGAALRQPEAELRPAQGEIVAEHVEQRRVSWRLDLAARAVDDEGNAGHPRSSSCRRLQEIILPARIAHLNSPVRAVM